jgi:hypothetical protein
MSVAHAPERYTLWVCQDCKQPAHGPGDRCPRDRRRTWTQMAGVEYVRADLREAAVEALRPFAALADANEQFGGFSDDEWTRVKGRTLRHASNARTVVRGQSE